VFYSLVGVGILWSAAPNLGNGFGATRFFVLRISAALAVSESASRVPNRMGTRTWLLFILFLVPADERLRLWEFVLGGIHVGTGIAVNLGLLGSGALAPHLNRWLTLQGSRGSYFFFVKVSLAAKDRGLSLQPNRRACPGSPSQL
jgi:hypothetical protein